MPLRLVTSLRSSAMESVPTIKRPFIEMPGGDYMVYVLLACRGVLALTLFLASASKTLYHEQFLEMLHLGGIPKILIRPVTVLIPILEMCLALGLVFSSSSLLPFVIALTLALLCLFTLWILTVYFRGLRLKCQCFGIAGSDIGPHTILRNVLMISLTVIGLVLSIRIQSQFAPRSIWFVVTVLSFGMSATLLWAFRQAIPALNLHLKQIERTHAGTAIDFRLKKQGGQ